MSFIMIVDDDADFAEASAVALRAAGHEVQIQLETEGVCERMEERAPDMLILDVMFPDDSSGGFELARAIRQYQDEKFKDIPILMLTAVNTTFPLGFGAKDIDDTWLPISDFVEKPVDISTLMAKVTGLLSK